MLLSVCFRCCGHRLWYPGIEISVNTSRLQPRDVPRELREGPVTDGLGCVVLLAHSCRRCGVSSGLVAPYRLFPRFLLWTLTFSTTAFFVALTDERIELVPYLLTRNDILVQGRSYRFAYHLESLSLAFMMLVRSWVNFGAGTGSLVRVSNRGAAPLCPRPGRKTSAVRCFLR